jgi:hypothetical protein
MSKQFDNNNYLHKFQIWSKHSQKGENVILTRFKIQNNPYNTTINIMLLEKLTPKEKPL